MSLVGSTRSEVGIVKHSDVSAMRAGEFEADVFTAAQALRQQGAANNRDEMR